MGRRQELAGRLAAQHVAPAGAVGQPIGRVGLAALELLGLQRRHEALDMGRHEPGERPLVETVLLLHLHRADVLSPFTRHPKPLNGHSLWPGVCSPLPAHATSTIGGLLRLARSPAAGRGRSFLGTRSVREGRRMSCCRHGQSVHALSCLAALSLPALFVAPVSAAHGRSRRSVCLVSRSRSGVVIAVRMKWRLGKRAELCLFSA